MKKKPDVSFFVNYKKDPASFLEGGIADAADNFEINNNSDSKKKTTPENIVQKLFRLRWSTASALKIGAAKESATTGRRVTETEIVYSLIREHYKIKE